MTVPAPTPAQAKRNNYCAPRQDAKPNRRQRVIEKYGLTCVWCGRTCEQWGNPTLDAFATVEHLKPKSEGGTSAMSNLRIACRKCNNMRHAKPKNS
jgi:5-methylcytosine-specific restriction endonuclease McrA